MSAQYLVNENSVKSILSGRGTTMANIRYKTDIAVAAKFKHEVKIEKRTVASVRLFQGIVDFEIYKKEVLKTAQMIEGQENVSDFIMSDTWFEHGDMDCFSLVSKKSDTTEKYLYFICNSAKSVYYINGELVTKGEIAQYLTPSKYKEIFENDGVVYNKRNGIMHLVNPRTLKLSNIFRLAAKKQVAIA